MPDKYPKKKRPSILSEDIYASIAGKTSLTQKQVAECFRAYKDYLFVHIGSQLKPTDLKISMPSIGTVSFYEVKGKKAGEIETIRHGFGADAEIEKVVLEKDKPDYEHISFKFERTFQELLRETTEARWRKEHED